MRKSWIQIPGDLWVYCTFRSSERPLGIRELLPCFVKQQLHLVIGRWVESLGWEVSPVTCNLGGTKATARSGALREGTLVESDQFVCISSTTSRLWTLNSPSLDFLICKVNTILILLLWGLNEKRSAKHWELGGVQCLRVRAAVCVLICSITSLWERAGQHCHCPPARHQWPGLSADLCYKIHFI